MTLYTTISENDYDNIIQNHICKFRKGTIVFFFYDKEQCDRDYGDIIMQIDNIETYFDDNEIYPVQYDLMYLYNLDPQSQTILKVVTGKNLYEWINWARGKNIYWTHPKYLNTFDEIGLNEEEVFDVINEELQALFNDDEHEIIIKPHIAKVVNIEDIKFYNLEL